MINVISNSNEGLVPRLCKYHYQLLQNVLFLLGFPAYGMSYDKVSVVGVQSPTQHNMSDD
jgi:hypothetical protein